MEQNLCETNALCVATTGERESCEFTDDQVLPPVEDTLSDVKSTHKQPVNEGLQPSEQLPHLVKQDSEIIVSSTQVRLISTVRLPANYAAAVPVKINEITAPALRESESLMDGCLQVNQSLVNVNNKDGLATLIMVNHHVNLRVVWSWQKLVRLM